MRISKLRHIIYIQTPTVSRNTRGAEAITWADSPALRAEVRTLGGDERQRDEQVIPISGHQVMLRWPLPTGTAISTKSRLRWLLSGSSRYFAVVAIGEPDNLRRRIEVACQELVGEDRAI